MKVCIIASTYPRSEEDTAVPWLREDVKRLRARGIDVQVFAPAHKGLRSHTIDGAPVHRFRYFFAGREDLTHDEGAPTKIRRLDYLVITLFYILFGTLALIRHQRRMRYDILHVHWPFPHAFMAIHAARVTPAPMVMSFHGAELLLSKKFKFVDPLLRSFTRRASALTCNSSYTAEAVRRLGTLDPVILPYGSPVPSRLTPLPQPQPDGERRILYVGRLIERKGVEYLIDAMPLLLEKVKTKLTIVGSGGLLESLRERAARLGLQQVIEFKVDIPDTELMQAYEDCELFVLPSIVDSRGDTEGLGVVLIEALSFGRPVVASNVGGIVDVIVDGKTGLLVPEKDPAALADAITRLLRDRPLAERLAEQGLRHVRSLFDWDQIMERTETLYSAVAAEPLPHAKQPPVAERDEVVQPAR